MPSRRSAPKLTLGALVLAVVVGMPGLTAQGHHSRPLFEFMFPAQPDLVTHHNDWGAERSSGRRHHGNDLMGPKMTGVYAFADGFVSGLGSHPRSGRYVRIDHEDDWRTYYIHLNNDNIGTDDNGADWSLTVAPGLAEGVEVKMGQLIGWIGDSGNAEWTRPHLHFELHRNDYPVNPYFTLREAWERDIADLEWLQKFVDEQSGDYRRN